MPSTKMFRDRVVSMEQTYEQGEKHLALLQSLVREALPDLEFKEYLLDHEHDNFVLVYSTPAGREKRITWTRMVLYDAERIPAIVENAESEIRGRIVNFLLKRADRPVIDVTFRHLEDGWIDTPEPRKPRPKQQQPQGRRGSAEAPRQRPESGRPQRQPGAAAPEGPDREKPAGAPAPAPAPGAGERPARGRRRFRRRRRGRGGQKPGGTPAP
jgi:hypothetical protein